MEPWLEDLDAYQADDDVKIWSGKTEGTKEEEDVKIWAGPEPEEEKKRTGRHANSAGRSAKFKGTGARILSAAAHAGESLRLIDVLGRRNIITVIVSVLLFAAVWFFPAEGKLKTAGFIAVFILAAFDVVLSAVKNAGERKFFDESLLLSAASIAALAIEEFAAAGLMILLYRICTLAENFIDKKGKEGVRELMEMRPESARAETETGSMTVDPELLRPGNVVQVEPGEQIPLDGKVLEGISTMDVSLLTGTHEARPVGAGSRVYSGAVNLTEPIRVRVAKVFKNSTAVRVTQIVQSAAENQSPLERLAGKVMRIYTPVMAAAALLISVVPPLFGGAWTDWIRKGVIFLTAAGAGAVITPLALAYTTALARAAKNGIMCKGSDRLEKLSRTATVVFDKTGTITEGKYKVTEVFPAGVSEEMLLSIAATAEGSSEHPIAEAIRAAGKPLATVEGRMLEIKELPGRGISAFVGKRHVYAGNSALLEEHGISCAMPSKPGTAVHVALDNRYCGHILVSDKLRDGTYEAIDKFRTLGVGKMAMLTGDVMSVARPLANKLNFDMVRPELLPEEKFAALAYLTDNAGEKSTVAFVTSGENDELMLARADVGIAMDMLGKDALLDEADIIIPGDDIRKAALCMHIAKRAVRAAQENVLAVAAVRLAVVLAGLLRAISLETAILCMAGVELAAALNATRTMMLHERREESKKRIKRNRR